jgi:toxin ParE1/3/4
LRIEFDRQALADLADIRDWIQAENPKAADRVLSRIRQMILMLGQFPKVGRAGLVPGTREFPVVGLPYIVVFRESGTDRLIVLGIVHTRKARLAAGPAGVRRRRHDRRRGLAAPFPSFPSLATSSGLASPSSASLRFGGLAAGRVQAFRRRTSGEGIPRSRPSVLRSSSRSGQ